MFFFLFRIFALQQLFLFSRENLRANLARGRPKFIPLRIPYVWPLCCQAHSVCIPRQVMECICRTIVTSEILYFTNLALLYFKLATFVWELLEKHNKCNLWSLKFWLTDLHFKRTFVGLIPNPNLYAFSTQRKWRCVFFITFFLGANMKKVKATIASRQIILLLSEKPSKLPHLISLHMSRNRSPSKKAYFPLINCFYYPQVLETMDTTGKQINPCTAPC